MSRISIRIGKSSSDKHCLSLSKEEEFIFFVTYATSKILKYEQNENEIYISLIFLNEILKEIPDKQFGKIWQNIFNIFKSKMIFKTVNEDNIFDYSSTNFLLSKVASKPNSFVFFAFVSKNV